MTLYDEVIWYVVHIVIHIGISFKDLVIKWRCFSFSTFTGARNNPTMAMKYKHSGLSVTASLNFVNENIRRLLTVSFSWLLYPTIACGRSVDIQKVYNRVESVANRPTLYEVIHFIACKAEFTSNVFNEFAVGKIRWLIHLSVALMLEKTALALLGVDLWLVDTMLIGFWGSRIGCNKHRPWLELALGLWYLTQPQLPSRDPNRWPSCGTNIRITCVELQNCLPFTLRPGKNGRNFSHDISDALILLRRKLSHFN